MHKNVHLWANARAALRSVLMNKPLYLHLSRRESQVMDIIFALGEASVAEVVERMPSDPGYNTVRNALAILERKGYLHHRQEGPRYLYSPAEPVDDAKRSAVRHLLRTFFQDSPAKAAIAVLGNAEGRLTQEDLHELSDFIERAREKAK